jgi:hypothetical protein
LRLRFDLPHHHRQGSGKKQRLRIASWNYPPAHREEPDAATHQHFLEHFKSLILVEGFRLISADTMDARDSGVLEIGAKSLDEL